MKFFQATYLFFLILTLGKLAESQYYYDERGYLGAAVDAIERNTRNKLFQGKEFEGCLFKN